MDVAQDSVLRELNEIVRIDAVTATVEDVVRRVGNQLHTTAGLMAWEVVSLDTFRRVLPESIRSCWIFVLRAGAATGAERHPNSHQRSFSLIGEGTFELRAGAEWRAHSLASTGPASMERRWVSIPPATWHRLVVGSEPWGMLSFHTVAPEELIEEMPVDAHDLDGETHQERYVGRQ